MYREHSSVDRDGLVFGALSERTIETQKNVLRSADIPAAHLAYLACSMACGWELAPPPGIIGAAEVRAAAKGL